MPEGLDFAVGTNEAARSEEDFIRQELRALIEGMVRTYCRRRLRSLLAAHIVLEVEREGEWPLGEVEQEEVCSRCSGQGVIGMVEDFIDVPRCPDCDGTGNIAVAAPLHFLSRHDALLLERTTGYLYLQSFKTTGSWDRRKELDAQVDMQGLSEAVDVERRFQQAWEMLQEDRHNDPEVTQAVADAVGELVDGRTAQWLSTLSDPPTILGVRYEYLLKGQRRKDAKADAMNPDRYYCDSKLVRAYKQEGITAEDRRWGWTYDWFDETGKGRRLDYRSWQKSAVWKSMPIADWIDLLDQGKVQEGALDQDGNALDPLAEQLVPVLTVYRQRDDALDFLEQVSAQEIQVAKDVGAVREAERTGGYSSKRSSLNRLFPQTRTACSYPGVCNFRSTPTKPGFCFGGPDPEHDPSVLEHYVSRIPNHPAETGESK